MGAALVRDRRLLTLVEQLRGTSNRFPSWSADKSVSDRDELKAESDLGLQWAVWAQVDQISDLFTPSQSEPQCT